MNHSELINEISEALVLAQAEFQPAKRTGANPLFGSVYATLDDMISGVRVALGKHGLAFLQPLAHTADGMVLETYLIHKSGQWFSTSTPIPTLASNRGTNELQAFGSAIKYMRRYTLSAMLGIAGDEDDDGNNAPKATVKKAEPPKKVEPPKKEPAKAQHWTADAETVQNFWLWTVEQALNERDVLHALNVNDLGAFKGTKAEAVKLIKDATAQ